MRKIFYSLAMLFGLTILFYMSPFSYGTVIPDGVYDCHGTQNPHDLEYSFDLQRPLRPFNPFAILFDICIDKEKQSMDLFVSSDYYRDGKMTVKIPRDELNPITSSCEDDVFQIKRSGKFTPYEEIKASEFREITFPIMTNDWQITIFTDNPENTKLCDKTITKKRTYTLEEALEIQRKRLGLPKINDSSSVVSDYLEELTFEMVEEIRRMAQSWKSPNQQIKEDIQPKDVVCKFDFELIFKSTDKSPICVKPATAEKLVERGWASMP